MNTLRKSMASLAHFYRNQPMPLCLALLASTVVVRYLHAKLAFQTAQMWTDLSLADCLLYPLTDQSPVPLGWMLSTAVSMTLLGIRWTSESEVPYIISHGSWRNLWTSQVTEGLVVAIAVSVGEMVLVVLSALLMHPAELINFGDPQSYFSLMLGDAPASSPSILLVGGACLILETGITALSTTCFAVLRWLLKSTAGAASLLLVMASPMVHEATSFVTDILRNFTGAEMATNPLYLLYNASSVSWSTWAGGADQRLWLYPLATLCIAGVMTLIAHKKKAL